MTTPTNDPEDRRRQAAAAVRGRVSARLGDLWWWFMVRGALAAVLGLCALIWPGVTLEILIVLVGIFCLADGLTGLFGALRAADRASGLAQALVSLAAGLVLLFWPGATIRVLLVVFGAWLLFIGIGQILAARREALDADDRRVMTTIGGLAALIGLVLVVWPGSGVVAISWLIAIAALLLAALLVFVALRLKRVKARADA